MHLHLHCFYAHCRDLSGADDVAMSCREELNAVVGNVAKGMQPAS